MGVLDDVRFGPFSLIEVLANIRLVSLQLPSPTLVARQAQHDRLCPSARQRRLPPPFVRSALHAPLILDR